MASKKPSWLSNLEARDAAGKTVVSQSPNYKKNNGGTVTATTSKPAGLGVDIRKNPGLSVFNNNQSNGTAAYSPVSTTTYTPSANINYTPGNYTIGSEYGKQQAQNMAIGSQWTAPDGSTWQKENDGTLTVYHNGTKSTNAWTPSDLKTALVQQMEAGVPRQYVNATLNSRVNKALNTEGLEQYAYDDTYWDAVNYIRNQILAENQPAYSSQDVLQYYKDNQPTYTDEYAAQIDALLSDILTREDFSYDAANDPLYQQYAAMYQREGDRAMRETLAEAAAGAGGMNSYAITAAQQANNYYGAQLNDKIPELYQLAYDMYLADKESDIQNLGILQNMSDSQYARYRDTMSDWNNDRNFAYGVYQDDVANGQWQQQFEYNAMINDRDFNYKVSDAYNQNKKNEDNLTYEREQAEKDDAYNRVIDAINNGASFESIGSDLIQKAGLSEAIVKDWIAKRDSGNFSKASGGSTGGSSRSSYSNDGYEDIVDHTSEASINLGKDTVSMDNLGLKDPNYFNVQQALSANGYFGLTVGNIPEKDIPRVISTVSDMFPDDGDEAKRILNKMGISDLQIDNAMRGPWK